uniref:Putative zinc-finger homeodomain protein 6 n=1 Tax=Davidia involucrata TaxID=16924 RepID=A0A5B7C0U2_DAVIN
MELRGEDKDIDMPNSSFPSCNPAQPNQESSFKLSSIVSTVTDRRRNETGPGSTIFNPTQTLDHQQQQQTQRPDPDPVVAAAIAGASNSKAPPPTQQQLQPTTSATNSNSTASIRYRECLRNHAASMGGHVVDGCGEFMPTGDEGTPAALKCAACDCHRNFHRKEVDGESQPVANCYHAYNPNSNSSQRTTIHPAQAQPSQPPPPPPQHKYSHGPIPQVMMAFGGNSGAPAEYSSSEDLNMLAQPSFSLSKKRFRTKFTQQQKDRMQEFAEKLEWKIQKQDEQELQLFCTEVGVKRKAFKVWMNNNKQAMKKKQL